MRFQRDLVESSAEDVFEDAPCGHVSTRPDGTIVRVNRTFEEWTGLARDQLIESERFQDLLSAGGRIYYETHYAPLLHMQGSVRAIAVELVRADGSRMPALVNSVLRTDEAGHPREIWTSVFDATDRRGYEDELLQSSRREHEIAEGLQRSMLGGSLPGPVDGCELDVAYRPAISGMQVGGDWYDAFWVERGTTIGLVVGDVVGRGVDAAATMAQLRSAVRALAVTGLSPGALLGQLDDYASRYDVGKMCTLVYAELDLANSTLRFACAGHPPPVLAVPGADPRLAWGGRSTPLAAFAPDVPRDDATEPFPPGSMVLLYTDGLVEERSRPVDHGMERLRRILGTHRDETTAAILDEVVSAAPTTAHADDLCALVARACP